MATFLSQDGTLVHWYLGTLVPDILAKMQQKVLDSIVKVGGIDLSDNFEEKKKT